MHVNSLGLDAHLTGVSEGARRERVERAAELSGVVVNDCRGVSAELEEGALFRAPGLQRVAHAVAAGEGEHRERGVGHGLLAGEGVGRGEDDHRVGVEAGLPHQPAEGERRQRRARRGFTSTLAPQASAGATLCATRFRGKLNGENARTGPSGTRS